MVARELAEPMRSHHDLEKENATTKHVKKALKHYAAVAKRVAAAGHAVDLFVCALDQCGLMEMKALPTQTGGYMVIAESFQVRAAERRVPPRPAMGRTATRPTGQQCDATAAHCAPQGAQSSPRAHTPPSGHPTLPSPRFQKTPAGRAMHTTLLPHLPTQTPAAMQTAPAAPPKSRHAICNYSTYANDALQNNVFKESWKRVLSRDANGALGMAFGAAVEVLTSAELKASGTRPEHAPRMPRSACPARVFGGSGRAAHAPTAAARPEAAIEPTPTQNPLPALPRRSAARSGLSCHWAKSRVFLF